MKKGVVFGIILLIILAVIIYYYLNNKNGSGEQRMSKSISADGKDKILTYRLPNSVDTEIFGPYYWGALHNVVDNIPCSICRNDAKPMMVFMHDLVNYKLDKPIFNPENFDKWAAYVCNIKSEREIEVDNTKKV